MIRFDQVSKSYGDRQVLNNFSLSIAAGELITIIGTSGSGKSTLIKLVNGLIAPERGMIQVEGVDISQIDQTRLRRRIGYMIQGIGLFPHMTIEENITYVLHLDGKNQGNNRKRVVELLQTINLEPDILNRYPDELSGGQKQRVGIARALAANPKILLMDEPFGAVDEITRLSLQEELLKIYTELGTTILFVTHDVREAFKLGTKVLILHEGRIQQFDCPERIRQSPANHFVKELIQVGER